MSKRSPFPTKEELDAVADFRNSMFYWFAKLMEIKDQLPIIRPLTTSIVFDKEDVYGVIEGKEDALERITGQVKDEIKKAQEINPKGWQYPLFMRTDRSSFKHSWIDTCFLQSEDRIADHVNQLIEQSFLHSIGNEVEPAGIFLRSLLNLKSNFTAFDGIPIAREYRLFAGDGKVYHIQPYWCIKSLSSKYSNPSDKQWLSKLKELYKLSIEEEALLVNSAEIVTNHIGDAWSIDFCQDVDDKWYLTDMALAKVSYKYTPAKNWRGR